MKPKTHTLLFTLLLGWIIGMICTYALLAASDCHCLAKEAPSDKGAWVLGL